MSKNAASGYFSTFRALLKKAYKEKLLTENVNDFLEYIEWDDVVKEFLNQDELIRLAQTPCDSDVLRRTLNVFFFIFYDGFCGLDRSFFVPSTIKTS